MNIPENLLYSEEHEWIRVDGNQAYIGITDYAQHALGDIVYVDLPAVGDDLSIGDTLGVVESVKAASDIYTPLSGKIIEVNGLLDDAPGLINEDCYKHWIAVVELSDETELKELLDATEYSKLCN